MERAAKCLLMSPGLLHVLVNRLDAQVVALTCVQSDHTTTIFEHTKPNRHAKNRGLPKGRYHRPPLSSLAHIMYPITYNIVTPRTVGCPKVGTIDPPPPHTLLVFTSTYMYLITYNIDIMYTLKGSHIQQRWFKGLGVDRGVAGLLVRLTKMKGSAKNR